MSNTVQPGNSSVYETLIGAASGAAQGAAAAARGPISPQQKYYNDAIKDWFKSPYS